MAKQYFYSDPIMAAYMAIYHDMHFTDEDGNGGLIVWAWEDIGFVLKDARVDDDPIGYPENLHVHPDSLHLLEPRVGDLILCSNYTGAKSVIKIGEHGEPYGAAFEQAVIWHGIIRRDGKPFLWPESEAA